MLACTDCSNYFEPALVKPDKEGDLVCPLKDCDGYLVEVDDQLADILTRLWTLGHWTSYSCAGHLWESDFEPHIAFTLDDENLRLKEIMDGMNDGTVHLETHEEAGEFSVVIMRRDFSSSPPGPSRRILSNGFRPSTISSNSCTRFSCASKKRRMVRMSDPGC